MAKYKYFCKECGAKVETIRSFKNRLLPLKCKCGKLMKLQLPNIMEPSVLETVDKKRKVKHRKDQASRIKKRTKEYFVENEMPDLIAKHGIEYAKKMGWVDKNGKPKKKIDIK